MAVAPLMLLTPLHSARSETPERVMVRRIKCSGCGGLSATLAAFRLHCIDPHAKHDPDFASTFEEVEFWVVPGSQEDHLDDHLDPAGVETRPPSGQEEPLDPAVEEWVDRVEALVGPRPERPEPQPGQLLSWGLFLGGLQEAWDVGRLAELGITAAVNLAPRSCGSLGELYEPSFEVVEMDAEDSFEYPLLNNHLADLERMLSSARARDQRVLVHCFEGRNRSATLCAAYMIRAERMTLTSAVSVLKDARGPVLKNRAFVRQLVRLAQEEGLLE